MIEAWRPRCSRTAPASRPCPVCSPERQATPVRTTPSARLVRGRDPDLRELMALLKALWKLRPPGEPEAPGARLIRRWRERRLLARLEQDWPGGLVLHPH